MAGGEQHVIPYYATPTVQIYHCHWEDLRDAGLLVDIDFIWADPPYGVKEKTARKAAGRGRNGTGLLDRMANIHDFPNIVGDAGPYDPTRILALDRPTVLWGANCYASRLPDSASWLEWDKREDMTSDDNGDFELAWTNLGGPNRKFRHWWRGALRKTEKVHTHLHPTQKPEELSRWGFQHAMARGKLKPGGRILVPYMGSGPELRPAQEIGCRVIACDVEELYCRTAVSARLGAVPHPEPAEKLGPLFGGA